MYSNLGLCVLVSGISNISEQRSISQRGHADSIQLSSMSSAAYQRFSYTSRPPGSQMGKTIQLGHFQSGLT